MSKIHLDLVPFERVLAARRQAGDIRRSADAAAAKARIAALFEGVFAHEGYQKMLAHNQLEGKTFAASVAGCLLGEDDPDERGRARGLADALAEDHLMALLDRMRSNTDRLIEEARRRALACLPDGARIEATVYVVPGGHSDAYGCGPGAVVLNTLYFSRSAESLLVKVLGHELHHIGFWSLPRPRPATDTDKFLEALLSEGAALFTQLPLTPEDEYYFERYREHTMNYERHIAELGGLLTDLSRTADLLEKGLWAHQDAGRWFWSVGPAYVVGCKMLEKIEEAFGRGEVVRLMQAAPVEFVKVYNTAVERKGGHPLVEF